MYIKNLLTIVILTIVLTQCDAAKILGVFLVPSISHNLIFRVMTNELLKRGHELVVITPDPEYPQGHSVANLTEVDVREVGYATWRKEFVYKIKGVAYNTVRNTYMLYSGMNMAVGAQMQSDNVTKLLEKYDRDYFDLIFIEAFNRPSMAFTCAFDAPLISVSTFYGMFEQMAFMGASTHPLLYPLAFRSKLNNLTLWEKIWQLYVDQGIRYMVTKVEDEENAVVKERFGDTCPDVRELGKRVDMLFLNVNPVWEGARPLPPSVIYMGGVHLVPPKELPKDLQTYLDQSKNGVVYISWGTNIQASQLPEHVQKILLNVFASLPYDFLLRWDTDEVAGKPDNVRIGKWFPQNDLLRHKNVKLFISQGGLQSTDEAIVAGVPLIGMPCLGDQWHNSEKYEHHGIGIRRDFDGLTEENFKHAIETAINDPKYRKNIVRLRELMHDQPQTSMERTIWWMEYVIRHKGAKHLRSPEANMSWAEYLMLDVIFIVFAIAIVLLTAAVYLLAALNRYVLRIFLGKDKKKTH